MCVIGQIFGTAVNISIADIRPFIFVVDIVGVDGGLWVTLTACQTL